MIKEMNWAEKKQVIIFFKEQDNEPLTICEVERVCIVDDFLRVEEDDRTVMYKTDIINGYVVERE